MIDKIYIKTYGCQMNDYDSEKLLAVMARRMGSVPVDDPREADAVVFNTCSVREKAAERMFSELGRFQELKQRRPDLLIAVGGCVASQEGGRIVKRAPFVDVVFGPQTLHRLPDLLLKRLETGKPQVDVSFPEIEKFDRIPAHKVAKTSACVSIMEGCSKYCSYCVVPYTRGEEFSRPLADVLVEVMDLAVQGVKEINFLGQNVNAYRGVDPDGGTCGLADLLRIVHAIPEIERLRFTTSHPREFTPALIQCFADLPKLSSYLHLPAQSGSDRVLAAMKRGYTALEYKSIARKLRRARPNLCLASDFIVGFPGETEEEFERTLQFARDVRFDLSYVFIYSPRPGTPAADMKDDTLYEEKLRRLKALNAVVEEEGLRINNAMVGAVTRCLVEGVSKRDPEFLQARSDNNRVVNFKAPMDMIGRMVDLRITQARVHSLTGELA